MIYKIQFFIRTIILSFSSLMQSWIHTGYEFLFPVKQERTDKTETILIVQLGHIGDFILSVPLINALKNFYGNKINIAVLIDQAHEDLAKNNSSIDNVIIYNSSKYSRIKEKNNKFPISELKNKIFNRVIWLRGDIHTFYWIVKNRIPMKSIARYSNPIRFSWLSLITKHPIKKEFKHFLECLDDMEKKIKPSTYACKIKGSSSNIFYDSSERIIIHVAAGNKLRKWPEENFAKLCKLLLDWDKNNTIYFIGSKEDINISEGIRNHPILKNYNDKIKDLCGKIKLIELDKLFESGLLYIGFDSGPMHIAALSGIPIVALLGPQSPQVFRPYGKQEIRIIYKYRFCSPCWQFACLYNKSGPGACILAITPEEVFKEACVILERIKI